MTFTNVNKAMGVSKKNIVHTKKYEAFSLMSHSETLPMGSTFVNQKYLELWVAISVIVTPAFIL